MRRLVAVTTLGVVVLGAAAPALAAARTTQTTWHGTQVRLYGAQAPGRDGAGVLVAVLDGWVDGTHPDFTGRVRAGVDCVSGTCAAGQAKDACTHGTHVAGTVASTSFGIAPKASVLPVQVLRADSRGECTGTPGAVAAGIRYAVAQHARVLNLSLGPDVSAGSGSTDIATAVHEAAQAGAVVVFSAGNAATATAQSYGADALIVAATGPTGALASYSERGAGVSIAAPGGQPTGATQDTCAQSSCVTSLYPGGKYAVAAGTSMAAPHVSGVAALLLAQQPSRTAAQVIARITATARPLADAGAGLLDASAALGVVARTTTPVTAKPVPVEAPSPPAQRSQTVPTTPKPAAPTPRATTRPAAPRLRAVPPSPAAVSPVPLADAPSSQHHDGGVPGPLAVGASLLVAAAGATVLTASRR